MTSERQHEFERAAAMYTNLYETSPSDFVVMLTSEEKRALNALRICLGGMDGVFDRVRACGGQREPGVNDDDVIAQFERIACVEVCRDSDSHRMAVVCVLYDLENSD